MDDGDDGKGHWDQASGSGSGDKGHHEAGEQDQEEGQEDEPERSPVQLPKTGH